MLTSGAETWICLSEKNQLTFGVGSPETFRNYLKINSCVYSYFQCDLISFAPFCNSPPT